MPVPFPKSVSLTDLFLFSNEEEPRIGLLGKEMSELLKQDEGCMLVKLLLAGSATMEVY